MTTTKARAEALADHPFLAALPVEALRRLAAHAYPRSYAAGEVVFREGDPADRFFLILDGRIRLEMNVAGRGAVLVENLGPERALGWSWLLEPHVWRLTATAAENASVLVFDAAMLRSLMASDPVIGYELMRRFAGILFDRLQATRARLGGDEITLLPGRSNASFAGRRSGAL